jgi:hypothetical protein
MPYENAPEVNPPIFPLAQNFLKDIVFSDNTHVAETASGCEYTCNDGYRVGSGTCGTTGGVANTTAVATITGSTVPLTTSLKATITNPGSGYTSAPTVTLT